MRWFDGNIGALVMSMLMQTQMNMQASAAQAQGQGRATKGKEGQGRARQTDRCAKERWLNEARALSLAAAGSLAPGMALGHGTWHSRWADADRRYRRTADAQGSHHS